MINWTQALTSHQSWLRTIVRSRISDQHAVDDVMQEISVAALKQNSRPTDPTCIGPWLYRLAVRQAINYRRRQGRDKRLTSTLQARATRSESAETNPRDWVLRGELQEQVKEAVGALSPSDRDIVLLKYSEQWTYRQLAEHLGIKEKTVEYRLAKAKEKLRIHLKSMKEE